MHIIGIIIYTILELFWILELSENAKKLTYTWWQQQEHTLDLWPPFLEASHPLEHVDDLDGSLFFVSVQKLFVTD